MNLEGSCVWGVGGGFVCLWMNLSFDCRKVSKLKARSRKQQEGEKIEMYEKT